jgi:outer membrane protein assembly factor BamB
MNCKELYTQRDWALHHFPLWAVFVICFFFLAACGPSVGAYKEQQTSKAIHKVASNDWSSYLMGGDHAGINKNESLINPVTAPQLKLHWTALAQDRIFSQPVVSNGLIYWGSGDGLEHATDLHGKQVWTTNLGTSHGICNIYNSGVLSTATVAPITMGGKQTSVVFVGGGNAHFYALNTLTGAIIWSTSLGSSPSHFLWASPVVFKGSVYEGVSSLADCPLVQGKFVQMDATTGAILHTFYTVPGGCVGASVWGSPTLDESDDAIYFATGNSGRCSRQEPYAVALVKLRASDLSYIDSWQVPKSRQIPDSDFGSTPTLFSATIGGVTKQLVGAMNKNTIYYAFDRSAIGRGPIWHFSVTCYCGRGENAISPGAWDGTHLYIAGPNTTIGKNTCKGSLRAVNPANGAFIWQHCLNDGPVYAAVTLSPGLAFISEGHYFLVIATANGKTLFRYLDSNEQFLGPPSISNGVIYVGSYSEGAGRLFAFGL